MFLSLLLLAWDGRLQFMLFLPASYLRLQIGHHFHANMKVQTAMCKDNNKSKSRAATYIHTYIYTYIYQNIFISPQERY